MKTVREPMRLHEDAEPFGASSRPVGAPLAPLLAGARARGVADGFEWLGLAAVLLDDRGEVLHANSGAIELMGEELYLAGGRVRARDLNIDVQLLQAVRDAILQGTPARVSISGESGQGGLHARVAAMDSLDDDPFQLLRVVMILDRGGVSSRERGGQTH